MHHHENPLILLHTSRTRSCARKKGKVYFTFSLTTIERTVTFPILFLSLSLLLLVFLLKRSYVKILSSTEKKSSIMEFSFNFISSRKHKTLNFSSGALQNECCALCWCKLEHYFRWDRYLLLSLKGKAQLCSVCLYSDVKWGNSLRLRA